MSKITLRLSDQDRVSRYLDASSFDFIGKRAELDAARQKLSPIQEECDRARAEYHQASAEINKDKAEKLARWRKLEEDYEYKYLAKTRYGNEDWSDPCELVPTSKRFKPDRYEAWNELQSAESAYMSVKSQHASEETKNALESKLREANQPVQALQSKLMQAEKALEEARGDLPEGALRLDVATLQSFVGFVVPPTEQKWFDGTLAEALGMIRGEITHECDTCHKGCVIVDVGDTLRVVLNDKVRHPDCYRRSKWDSRWMGEVQKTFPDEFRRHRLHSLAPWTRSPIRIERQEKLIGKIRSCAEDVRGWMMLGPGGASKSTYAAAAVTDMLTLRLVDGCPPYRLNFWFIKVPDWLRDMEAWERRDFDDYTVEPPSIQPGDIKKLTRESEQPPILWIEELDKFNPTPTRLGFLFRLVESVYSSGGTIIATSNCTETELRKRLGEPEYPIYRRISGENDNPEKFWVLDLWPKPKRKAASKG